jgi:DNA-binding transcriptional ArsR family regulator
MSYKVEFDSSPLYDLDFSLRSYINPHGAKLNKLLDIGPEWQEQVRSRFDSNFNESIKGLKGLPFLEYVHLLVWKSPKKDNINEFLYWLRQLTISELHEILAPYMGENKSLPFDVLDQLNVYVNYLTQWYEHYFSKMEKELNQSISLEINKKIKHMDQINEELYVEELSGGVVIEEKVGLETVVLVPTYHFSPFATSCLFHRVAFVHFPIDILQDEVAKNTKLLVNIGRAMSDSSRLKILETLSEKKLSFKEIVSELGSSKGNIHHHLLLLRAAKMLRLHETGDRATFGYYSTRKQFTGELNKGLNAILQIK